jgi:hypothetical protein
MIKCSCNNQKCEGVCCRENLLRPRKELEVCPSAFMDDPRDRVQFVDGKIVYRG